MGGGSKSAGSRSSRNHWEECEYAPDKFLNCINIISCARVANCCSYHCVDRDEDDGPRPVSTNALDDMLCCGGGCGPCSPPTPNHPHYREQTRRRKKRCLLISILSLCFPCFWIYPPCKAGHRAARDRRCCFSWACCNGCLPACVGGRHEPLQPS